MYKIFVNDKVIILTNVQDYLDSVKYFLLEDMSMDKIMTELHKKDVDKIVLYHPKEKKLLNKFVKKIKLVRAAGGIVTNEKKQILFIKRKGKWDLPKGKLDKGETLSQCALREVKEETGIKDLILLNFRAITYHIFHRDGKYQLKETHWFNMYSTTKAKFIPQIEEDIEKVKWKKPEKIAKILQNSYGNIRELFEKEQE